MTTELAWSRIRYQPESALSCWFRERFGSGGKRLRRIGIVAVARKLLIALWRFLNTGVLPEGTARLGGPDDLQWKSATGSIYGLYEGSQLYFS